MRYLVSYDLKEQKSYQHIEDKITDIDKEAQKILNTQWIVNWQKDSVTLGYQVLRVLKKHDSLLITNLEKDNAASYNLKGGVTYGTTLQFPPQSPAQQIREKAES